MIKAWESRTKALVFGVLVIICIIALASVTVLATNSDKYISAQWYYNNLNDRLEEDETSNTLFTKKELISGIRNIREGKIKQKNNDTVIAVIDTLVDWSHEDLKGKAWTNADEIPNDDKDNDSNGYVDDCHGYNFLEGKGITSLKTKNPGAHGTAIAGIICANTNNRVGIAGITGEAHIKVMNLAVLDSITSEGDINNLISAIKYAEKNGAKICNISSNYAEADAVLMATIKQSKMLFVVSAGNRPTLGVSLDKVANVPANYNFGNVITVSAYTQKYRILRQANYGPKTVDILAPGDEILTLIPENQYAYFSGTSIATPIITGVAALLDQNTEKITAVQLKQQLLTLASHNDDFTNKIKQGAYLQIANLLYN